MMDWTDCDLLSHSSPTSLIGRHIAKALDTRVKRNAQEAFLSELKTRTVIARPNKTKPVRVWWNW